MTTVNFVLIGKRIKEIRCGQRITQAMLAEMTELSISYISHIETAYKQASLELDIVNPVSSFISRIIESLNDSPSSM